MVVQENSIRIEIPDGRGIRLKECAPFDRIRGDTLHDFDLIWQNPDDPRLWLVELKDYGELIDRDPNYQYLLANLKDKCRDTLYVLASTWAGSEFGDRLREDVLQTFPGYPDTAVPVRPVIILNLEPGFEPLLGKLKTALNADQDLMSTLAVMDVESVLVVPPGHPFIRDQLQVTVEVDSA